MGWQPSRRRRLPPTQPCALGTCPTPQSPSQSSLYFSKEPASHALRMRSRRLPLASLSPPTLPSSTLALLPCLFLAWRWPKSHSRYQKPQQRRRSGGCENSKKRQRPKGVAPPRPPPIPSPAAKIFSLAFFY